MKSVLHPQKVSNRSLHMNGGSNRDILADKRNMKHILSVQETSDSVWYANCLSNEILVMDRVPASNSEWQVDCDPFRSVAGVICIKEFPRPALPKPLDDIKLIKLDNVPLSMLDSYRFSDIYGGAE